MGNQMLNKFMVACLLQAASTSFACAAGPYGTIHVGAWIGGAYTDDSSGNFSHCAAVTAYANGVSLIVSQTATGSWLLGFGSPSFRFSKGQSVTVDVTFDGQSQARLFATANLPPSSTP
jgi:hypothetical protein